jgi:hypothetical protein
MRWGKIAVLGRPRLHQPHRLCGFTRRAVLDKAPDLRSLWLLIIRRRHDKEASERNATRYTPAASRLCVGGGCVVKRRTFVEGVDMTRGC